MSSSISSSSSTPPSNSNSGDDDNSNSNNTPSVSDSPPTSQLVPPPPSHESHDIHDSTPPNDSNSGSNSSNSNLSTPPPPQSPSEENPEPSPTPPPNNSNSNSNSATPPPPQQSEGSPKYSLPPPTPQASNSPSVSLPTPPPNSSKSNPLPPPTNSNSNSNSNSKSNPNPNPSPNPNSPNNSNSSNPNPNSPNNSNNSNSKASSSPPLLSSPTLPPPQGEASSTTTNPKPPTLDNPSTTLPPQNSPSTPKVESTAPLKSPYIRALAPQVPTGRNYAYRNTGIFVGGFLIIIALVVFLVVKRRKMKAKRLLYQANQPSKPNIILYQQSGTPPADPVYGQPRISTSSQTYSAGFPNPNGSFRAGYFPVIPNEHNGSRTNFSSSFSYEEITDITSNFSRENMIGEGGFGCVYKGWMQDGRCVAVKQLKAGSGQGEREFRAEVEIISRIHHRHLVSLVGYCVVDHHRMLVYEFVPNNTLEYHLHGKGVPVMDWGKRVKIAIGAARGLAYLHEDCQPRIIHRDIKSANILLDYAFEAQVADFGLAKLTNDSFTHVSTRIMGTFGYLAPEYASSGKLTDRSDVFSFGVVLLELISGRKPVDGSQPPGEESLVEWARPALVHALETGQIEELVDPRLGNNYDRGEMFRMIQAAAACIRHSAAKRPRMIQVKRALDNDGGSTMDLTNGVKVGQSMAFNASQNSHTARQRYMALVISEEESSGELEQNPTHRLSNETPNRPLRFTE